MGAEGVALAISLAYFFSSVHNQLDGEGALVYFLILHYFQNCEIKNTGLTHCFCSLRAILTKLLLVRTYIQLMTYFWLVGIE